MIFGVGVDLIRIDRVKRAVKRKKFLEVTFTPEELACYEEAGCPVESLAGKFALKEAVFKALGTGWIDGREVEVDSEESGRPVVKLSGESLHKMNELGVSSIHVSLSYYGDYAVGLAVAEK